MLDQIQMTVLCKQLLLFVQFTADPAVIHTTRSVRSLKSACKYGSAQQGNLVFEN